MNRNDYSFNGDDRTENTHMETTYIILLPDGYQAE